MVKINSSCLNAGIQFWLKEKPRWGNDFHNSLYKNLSLLRADGLTKKWWTAMPDILWRWVAIRPKTKQFIFRRGEANLYNLSLEYKHILHRCHGRIPTNVLVKWKDVEPLFTTAENIKNVQSPVFASKLCHFIVQGIFPVIDQEVLGGSRR